MTWFSVTEVLPSNTVNLATHWRVDSQLDNLREIPILRWLFWPQKGPWFRIRVWKVDMSPGDPPTPTCKHTCKRNNGPACIMVLPNCTSLGPKALRNRSNGRPFGSPNISDKSVTLTLSSGAEANFDKTRAKPWAKSTEKNRRRSLTLPGNIFGSGMDRKFGVKKKSLQPLVIYLWSMHMKH